METLMTGKLQHLIHLCNDIAMKTFNELLSLSSATHVSELSFHIS